MKKTQTKNKRRPYSLTLVLTIVLMSFVAAMLGVIYLFEINFLDDFYYESKIRELEEYVETLTVAINDGTVRQVSDDISYTSSTCVLIKYGQNNEEAAMSDFIDNEGQDRYCSLYYLSDEQYQEIYDSTNVVEEDDYAIFSVERLERTNRVIDDLYVVSKVIDSVEGELLLMVADTITPLAPVISTIQLQFIYIIAFVIILTIILALFLSILFIKPLKVINEEAKTLPLGIYDGDEVNTLIQEMDDINETLMESRIAIEQADVARKELLSNVSHDLRTPLTMIVGYGEMMIDFDDEKTNDNIKLIIDEAKRLSNLVNDLLDLSKAELGKLDLNLNEVSLNEFLTSVYAQYRRYIENQNIDFSIKLDKDIKCVIDSDRIRQVMYNFINNAMNYNDKAEPKISIYTTYENGAVVVNVLDNGKGIAKEDIEKIWERYYKVDKEHKRQLIGSGIGLSLARMILECHEIEYGVDSKLGEYSRFYFKVKEVKEKPIE